MKQIIFYHNIYPQNYTPRSPRLKGHKEEKKVFVCYALMKSALKLSNDVFNPPLVVFIPLCLCVKDLEKCIKEIRHER
jgi:hypothetical protein